MYESLAHTKHTFFIIYSMNLCCYFFRKILFSLSFLSKKIVFFFLMYRECGTAKLLILGVILSVFFPHFFFLSLLSLFAFLMEFVAFNEKKKKKIAIFIIWYIALTNTGFSTYSQTAINAHKTFLCRLF